MGNNKAKRNKYFNNCTNYIFVIVPIIVIITTLVFSSGLILPNYANPISNISLTIINIIFTFLFSYKIANFTSLKNQKKLAISSVRNIRSYLSNLKNIKGRVNNFILINKNKLIKQQFEEIANSISSIIETAKNSVDDFKDIVNEEFIQENAISIDINEEFNLILEKYIELEKLYKSEKTKASDEKASLKTEIKDLTIKIKNNVDNLPFGGSNLLESALFSTKTASEIVEEGNKNLLSIINQAGISSVVFPNFIPKYKCLDCGNEFQRMPIVGIETQCSKCSSANIENI